MSTLLPNKDPRESVVVSFLFANDLQPGEILLTCTITATVDSGYDATPEAILFGTPDLSHTPTVLHEVRGGNHGTTYKLRAEGATDKGRPLLRVGLLPVVTE
jgi:hypothetical protein